VISWCGMRGIVTLAAAYALPEGFPYRDLILLTAFAVVLGSLVIQGLTLRPLIRWLGLKDEIRSRSRSPARAGIAYRAALDEIDGDPSEVAEILRLEYRALLRRAESDPHGGVSSGEAPRRSAAAQRHCSGTAVDPEDAGLRRDRRRCVPTSSRKNSTAPN